MTRTARIAAGFVLILGALELARSAVHFGTRHQVDLPSWQIIVGTWTIALAAALAGSIVPDRASRGHVASFVLPSVGVALMMPLTIHLVAFRVVATIDGFDEWVFYSLIFVGLAHVVFAGLVGLRAADIVQGRGSNDVKSLFMMTVMASTMPGAIVILPIPIVAATMVPLLPLLYAMKHFSKAPSLPTATARRLP